MTFKPSKQKKAQSAMEYLMTYGWAILIIAVVLGALFSLGVFSGSSLLGNACIASSGYLCQNPVYSHGTIAAGSTAGNIIVSLGQNTGTGWTSANFVFVPQGTISVAGVPQCGGISCATNAMVVYTSNSQIASGETLSATLPVSGLSSTTISVGQAATGTIWAYYVPVGSVTYQYAQIASINIKAS